MKIIESLIQSATGNIETCEDTFFQNNNFAVVIDGATNVSDQLLSDQTPGQLAAKTIKEAVSKLQGTENITEIIHKINEHYQKLYQTLGIYEEVITKPYLRPSASMIIYSKHHQKVWMIGDCQCYFNDELYQNIKHVDVVFEEVRSIIVKSELLSGKTMEDLMKIDIGFNLIKPLIQKQYAFQNADPGCSLSYGVVNGFPIPEELIKTIHVPSDVTHISLASDGYPRIYGTLKETEEELARLLEIDPLCIEENRSAKGLVEGNVSFDDRTYIRVEILEE